ncbi:MAG: outer membrane protein assembly factor BamD, partial [Deltaproteobacteria bacterium]|nr:outer membrane protein assembly factor BamD [Deltaproteobacteria bacterium]
MSREALVFFTLLIIFTAGCSLPFTSKSSKKGAPKSNADAAVLLKEGSDYLEKKKYSKAILKFETIREKYPFSAEASETDLLIGEAYFRAKKYSEAEATYKDFLTLRPTNEKVPMVIYQLGMVHFDQFTTIDRDQKNIETALGYFDTVVKKYPTSPYAAEAQKKGTKCRQYLAEREYYIGSFYLKEEKYAAARERFERIVRLYLHSAVGIKALYQLGEAYRMENNSVKAALAYEALIRHYPNSSQAKQAKVQLSQLNKVQHDPLAQLLMQDGRPVLAAGPATNGSTNGFQGTAQGPSTVSTMNLATKKDVTF